MARTRPEDARKQRAVFTKRLEVSTQAHFRPEVATLDDIVFLPANLSRLVIDPYRDACRVDTPLGPGLELRAPFLAAGFDEAADGVRAAVAHGLAAQGLAYLGRRPIGHGVPWLQLVTADDDASVEAAAVIGPRPVERLREGQLVGMTSARAHLPEAIPLALDRGCDVLVLEASGPITGSWPELAGAPDLAVMRDAIRILRELNREEDIALLAFGGVRTGTDAAKLIALGANAAVVGTSLALAVGGRIESGALAFYGDIDQDERDEKAELFLGALRAEASIMPRCTGKTDIHNLEPEDLRAISIVTAEATGIPLAGFNPRLAATG